MEPLELRVMLSTVFTPTTTDLHNFQNGPLAKAGSNLADLYLQYRAAKAAGTLKAFAASSNTQSASPDASAVDVENGTVGVELVTSENLTDFEKSMQSLGMSIQSITPADNAIAGFLDIGLLSQVAQSSDVLHVTPLQKPVAYQQGEAPNQADAALEAATARTTYGVTGAGVNVGVISDSVNQVGGGLASSVATGDLPNNVTVIQDGEAGDTDEGRAILEEIYDLAPGAKLYFDTAGDSQQSMATAVTALQQAGCNVIIDDIGFEEEPYFQPGVIDAAIDTAVAAGVTYVTAAGNEGSAGFEQSAAFVAATDGTGDQLINFNAAGSTPETMMQITIAGTSGPADLTLEWDDAYNGVTGTVNADLDFYLYNAAGTNIRYSSTDNTFATGVPVQTIENVQPGTYQVEIVAVNTPTADLPRYYEFANSEGFESITTEYAGLHTSVIGHAGLSSAISVGAVDFSDAPPVSTASTIPTEDFTSDGPVVESRDVNGNLLTSALTIDVPEVSGSDGNNTSFFGDVTSNDPTTYPQFFGTSGAAGNVAGVVALLKQADPGGTPAQFLAALESTAKPVNGAAADTYNDAGGYGLVDAAAAIAQLQSTSGGGSGVTGGGGGGGGGGVTVSAPAAAIIEVSPNPRAIPVPSIDIDFSEEVSGFTISDLDLSFNGGANLLTSSQTLTSTNAVDYVLGNLSSLTSAFGQYVLTLDASGSGIESAGGVPLADSASTDFIVEAIAGPPPVPVDVKAGALSTDTAVVTFNQTPGDELGGFILQRSTNSGFTGKVISYYLTTESDEFTDTGLTPGTVYYYRIASYNRIATSAYSRDATAITYGVGEQIIDDSAATGVTINGQWNTTLASSGIVGPDYLDDGDSGEGTKSVKYRPNLPQAGEYYVYADWAAGSDRATNVPIDIFSKTGVLLRTVRVNEQINGGTWVLLGEFDLHSETAPLVRIRNTGANGDVIADAIKFLPAGEIERNDAIGVTATLTTSAAIPAAIPPASAADEKSELQSLRDEVE